MHHLLDLPSELLCHISKNLANDELLVLCIVSKQLHFAALTVYFDRFAGVNVPTNAPASICQPTLAALRGLLLALWVKKFGAVSQPPPMLRTWHGAVLETCHIWAHRSYDCR
ncbi:hypothetical protein BDR07DRAFT_468688 [Suillus spraguei]|nr:hypothetical protein BDR07DRAFT_468688 [Suillus spraguei]